MNATKQFMNNLNTTASQRTKCEIWTRVMGYHRPVSHFNVGKKTEFETRTFFEEQKTTNSDFIAQYAGNE